MILLIGNVGHAAVVIIGHGVSTDLHVNTLHLLSLDQECRTHDYAGRDFRLTDAKGSVAEGIPA